MARGTKLGIKRSGKFGFGERGGRVIRPDQSGADLISRAESLGADVRKPGDPLTKNQKLFLQTARKARGDVRVKRLVDLTDSYLAERGIDITSRDPDFGDKIGIYEQEGIRTGLTGGWYDVTVGKGAGADARARKRIENLRKSRREMVRARAIADALGYPPRDLRLLSSGVGKGGSGKSSASGEGGPSSADGLQLLIAMFGIAMQGNAPLWNPNATPNVNQLASMSQSQRIQLFSQYDDYLFQGGEPLNGWREVENELLTQEYGPLLRAEEEELKVDPDSGEIQRPWLDNNDGAVGITADPEAIVGGQFDPGQYHDLQMPDIDDDAEPEDTDDDLPDLVQTETQTETQNEIAQESSSSEVASTIASGIATVGAAAAAAAAGAGADTDIRPADDDQIEQDVDDEEDENEHDRGDRVEEREVDDEDEIEHHRGDRVEGQEQDPEEPEEDDPSRTQEERPENRNDNFPDPNVTICIVKLAKYAAKKLLGIPAVKPTGCNISGYQKEYEKEVQRQLENLRPPNAPGPLRPGPLRPGDTADSADDSTGQTRPARGSDRLMPLPPRKRQRKIIRPTRLGEEHLAIVPDAFTPLILPGPRHDRQLLPYVQAAYRNFLYNQSLRRR